MMAPFLLWCCVVCVVYGVSIALLKASITPVASLVGAERVHFYAVQAMNFAVAAATAPSKAAWPLPA